MLTDLRLRSASAPPSACTASLTSFCTCCADAGWLSASSKAAEIDNAYFMRFPPVLPWDQGLLLSAPVVGNPRSLAGTLASTKGTRTTSQLTSRSRLQRRSHDLFDGPSSSAQLR